MTRLLLTGLFLFIMSISVYSQSNTTLTTEDLKDLTRHNIITQRQATETVGSPYLYEQFVNGKVTLDDGKVTQSISLNYNIYENRVEFRDRENIFAMPTNDVHSFIFENVDSEIQFQNGFESQQLDSNEFVQVLVDGDVKLLKKYEIAFQENVAVYGSATQRDEYISNERYYVHENGETTSIRRLNNRRVLRSVDQYRDELNQYIDEHNIDVSNDQDLTVLFSYYDTLL